MNKASSKIKIADTVLFLVLFVLFSCMTFMLFNRQTHSFTVIPSEEYINVIENNIYPSDMGYYVLEIEGAQSRYSYPYPVFFVTGKLFSLFTDSRTGLAIATVLFNSLALLLLKIYLMRYAETEGLKYFGTTLIALSLMTLSMLYTPPGIYLPGIRYKYVGVFTPNPFHNATYMAARPFAIVAFFSFVRLLKIYENSPIRENIREYLIFAISLLLSTMTKPSYAIVHIGTAGIIMLYRLCKNRFTNIIPTICLGLCFVPTFADLIYQYSGVFTQSMGEEAYTERGIGIGFGEVWRDYCGNIPLAICLAMAFPLCVFLIDRVFFRSKEMPEERLSLQMYIMSFLMTFFLYEKGFRKADFNFSWSYMYGLFFAFVGAVLVLLRHTKTRRQDDKKAAVLLCIEWGVFALHTLCGLVYLYDFMLGRMYY